MCGPVNFSFSTFFFFYIFFSSLSPFSLHPSSSTPQIKRHVPSPSYNPIKPLINSHSHSSLHHVFFPPLILFMSFPTPATTTTCVAIIVVASTTPIPPPFVPPLPPPPYLRSTPPHLKPRTSQTQNPSFSSIETRRIHLLGDRDDREHAEFDDGGLDGEDSCLV